MNDKAIIKTIVRSRPMIIARLRVVIRNNKFNYRTFGTDIEDYLFNIIISILKSKKLITDDRQFKRAKDKNEFPDLTIRAKPEIALEAKSGNRSKLFNGVWKSCNNSGNDLGTLNMWERKLTRFNGNNILFIFVEYNFTNKIRKIVDVKIEPFYKFIGLNRVGLLSYREKDGNLRPKDFNEEPPIRTLRQFSELLPPTKIYRASRLARKHLDSLSDDERSRIIKDYLSKK